MAVDEDTVPGAPRPIVATAPPDLLGPDMSDTVAFGTTTGWRAKHGGEPLNTPPASDASVAPTHRGPVQRIRIGDGDPIPLDRPILIGRAPRLPRIRDGVDHVLVRVDAPRREVSSTHVELRQVGGAVVVRDLRATNGSRIQPPGGTASRLAQGESMVVGPGTTIDIGDGNVIWVLGQAPAVHAVHGSPAERDSA